ncbi:MOSC domain-containing protein [Catenulispora sp. NF23]|uniref:MOSC domain-containing protein n=1 Tax=Catenulispora pinistramenti TaxID=2705254 RepID=A0ABS5KUB5_9ACTN|nr:MOSC N-terminal beta barrel domain-containing protein [Catenulispora pinistramenti]MBS2539472.1 MOSC domain-containing protein [Catenulispora pinistramenti]MBS2549589.1 MOSC domain-containing protein [Catenulispora pinistramenti]
MYVKELWRYPVKSMRGERLSSAEVTPDGIAGDRLLHVRDRRGVLTGRTRHNLLGMSATTHQNGEILVDGEPWAGDQSAAAVRAAAGPDAELVRYTGPERFDVLNLMVATDGAIAALGHDGRRLRPNIVIGGVPGLAERTWPGLTLRIGDVLIGMLKLRARCIVTTIDPDTGEQNLDVLRTILRGHDGRFALDSWAAAPGVIRVGDDVELIEPPEGIDPPAAGGWIVGAPYTVP